MLPESFKVSIMPGKKVNCKFINEINICNAK